MEERGLFRLCCRKRNRRMKPRQDLGNIPRMQKGLHSRGIRHIWLASHHEKIILNMHQELDRYLKA